MFKRCRKGSIIRRNFQILARKKFVNVEKQQPHVHSSQPLCIYVIAFMYIRLSLYVYTSQPPRIYVSAPTYLRLSPHVYTSQP